MRRQLIFTLPGEHPVIGLGPLEYQPFLSLVLFQAQVPPPGQVQYCGRDVFRGGAPEPEEVTGLSRRIIPGSSR